MFKLLKTPKYLELDETATVLVPTHTTTVLLPEHFSMPLAHFKYPLRLDFASERFQLRSRRTLDSVFLLIMPMLPDQPPSYRCMLHLLGILVIRQPWRII